MTRNSFDTHLHGSTAAVEYEFDYEGCFSKFDVFKDTPHKGWTDATVHLSEAEMKRLKREAREHHAMLAEQEYPQEGDE